MHRHAAGVGLRDGRGIDGGLQPRNQPVPGVEIGLRHAFRRHLACTKLAHDFLPGFSAVAYSFEVQAIELESGGLQPLVVTRDAVLIEHRPWRHWRGPWRLTAGCHNRCESNKHSDGRCGLLFVCHSGYPLVTR